MKFIFLTFIFATFLFSKHKPFEYSFYADVSINNNRHSNLLLKIANLQINKNKDLNINLKLYLDEEEVFSKFKDASIKLLFVSLLEYFKNRNTYDKYLDDIFVHKVNGSILQEYYLITNKDNVDVLDNLSEYIIGYESISSTSLVWFKTFAYKKYKKRYQDIVKNTITTNKANVLVTNVFFKKDYISIISKKHYDDLLEFNMQLKNKIKIIKKSKRIYIDAFTLANKNLTKEEKKRIKDVSLKIKILMSKMSFTFGGTLSGFYKINKTDLKVLEDIFLEYYKLVDKYEK